ncbi:hypothetical protein RA281_28320, partial [Pseudomonas syringae pv. tagetis]
MVVVDLGVCSGFVGFGLGLGLVGGFGVVVVGGFVFGGLLVGLLFGVVLGFLVVFRGKGVAAIRQARLVGVMDGLQLIPPMALV